MPLIYLTDLLPYVVPYAPSCPDMVAVQQIRRAAIEFCGRTKCWRDVITQNVTESEALAGFVITTPANAAVHMIDSLTLDGADLRPRVYNDATTQERAEVGTPDSFTQPYPGTILIYPAAAGEVKVTAFLKPRNGQAYGQNGAGPTQNFYDQIPDYVFDNYVDPIAHGALSHILSLPGQTFSDPQAAMIYAGRFESAITKASVDYLTGQQRAPLRTKTYWA